jgi:hypothetical protein
LRGFRHIYTLRVCANNILPDEAAYRWAAARGSGGGVEAAAARVSGGAAGVSDGAAAVTVPGGARRRAGRRGDGKLAAPGQSRP